MTYRHHYAGRQAWRRLYDQPRPDPAIVQRYSARRVPISRPYAAAARMRAGLQAYLLSIADEEQAREQP